MSGIVSMAEGKLRETLFGLKSVSKHSDLYVVSGEGYDIVVRNTKRTRDSVFRLIPYKARVYDVIVDMYYDATEYAGYTMRQALQDKKGCAKLVKYEVV